LLNINKLLKVGVNCMRITDVATSSVQLGPVVNIAVSVETGTVLSLQLAGTFHRPATEAFHVRMAAEAFRAKKIITTTKRVVDFILFITYSCLQ
jgi:hypothetical protein